MSFRRPPQSSAPSSNSSSYDGRGAAPSSAMPPSSAPSSTASNRQSISIHTSLIHYTALKSFLAVWLEKESPGARASAREKLTRLTKQQFGELGTDVYDELVRRQSSGDGTGANSEVAFLPVRPDFHPKRNQARQKLATLPKNRFKDLASDVLFELGRRFPEFNNSGIKEEDEEEESSEQLDPETPHSNYSNLNQLQSQQSQSQYSHQKQPSSASQTQSSNGPNRFPPPAAQHGRRPSHASQGSQSSLRSLGQQPPLSTQLQTVQQGVVIPTKSTIAEEEIKVPYATEHESNHTHVRPPSSTKSSRPTSFHEQSLGRMGHGNGDSSDDGGRVSPTGRGGPLDRGMGPIDPQSQQQQHQNGTPNTLSVMPSPNPTVLSEDKDYYDRMSFGSAASRGVGLAQHPLKGIYANGSSNGNNAGLGYGSNLPSNTNNHNSSNSGRNSPIISQAELDELKSTKDDLASQVEILQSENAAVRANALEAEDTLKQEAEGLKERVKDLQEMLETSRNDGNKRIREHGEAVRKLKESHERDMDDLNNLKAGQDSAPIIADLQNQTEDLLKELRSLSQKNDELLSENERLREARNQAEVEGKEWKRRWELVKVELRNVKATSQMFIQAPLPTDDHLPSSSTGAIGDLHHSAFQKSIDSLITSARSITPTSVLGAMKSVVVAMADISADIDVFERRPLSERYGVDMESLQSLKERSNITLNTLMGAAKAFAMSYGLSPVSLLDAAASEVSANVVALIRLLGIRRIGKSAESMGMSRSNSQGTEGTATANGGTKSPTKRMSRNTFEDNQNVGIFGAPIGGTLNVSTRTVRQEPLNDTHPKQQNGRDTTYRSTTTSSVSSAFDLERKPSTTLTSTSAASSNRGLDDRFDEENEEEFGFVAGNHHLLHNNSNSSNEGDRDPRESLAESNTSSSTRGPDNVRGGGFDRMQNGHDGSMHEEDREEPDEEGDEDDGTQAWIELKPYLETQSEAIVQSIQTLLSAIRAGDQGPELRETLSEVIAIGSSIVAVSKEALPAHSIMEGRRLLRDLVDNCDKLSELQTEEVYTKPIRQKIATSSFNLAKSLKELMNL